MQRALPLAVIIGLFIVQAVLRYHSELVSDAAWYLYVANGLLQGKRMYVDYLEVNPPLAFWVMIPIAWVGAATPLGFINALYVSLLAFTAASVALVNRYLKMSGNLATETRQWLCVAIAAVALFSPAGDFGEREHFMVLLFLPWLFLRFARQRGTSPSVFEAILMGVLAAIAICIKPQSVVAPLAAEVFFLWRYRQWRLIFATENLAAMVFATAYVLALVWTEPEFMAIIVGLGVKAYMPFYGYPAELIWAGGSLSALLIILALLLGRDTRGPMADIAGVAAACAAGFLLSYFIQYKGFSYQALTALAFSSIACLAGILALISQVPIPWTAPRKLLMGGVVLLAGLHLGTTPQACVCDERISAGSIATYAPRARSVFIASIRVGSAFPLVLRENLVWASRLPTSWLTPYVATNWHDGPLPGDEIVAKALDWAVTDFSTFRPDIVFVDESTEQLQVKSGYFDYVKFWSNDPRFAPIWAGYERRASVNGFAIYTLK